MNTLKKQIESLCAMLIFAVLQMNASTFTVGNLVYETSSEDDVLVKRYKNTPESIDVPSNVNYAGKVYQVVGISEGAFSGCTSLKSVEIGSNILTIGRRAFSECTSIESIYLPESVQFVDVSAFNGCSSLTDIDVSDGNAVYGGVDGLLCSKDGKTLFIHPYGRDVTELKIPEGIETLGESVFEGRNIKSLNLPLSLITIGLGSFANCLRLVEVYLPSSLVTIGDGAFFGCENLKTIDIPSSVSYIGDRAFYYCRSLKNVTINGSISYLGAGAFELSSVESIDLKGNISQIKESTFSGCSHLKRISLPESVSSIGVNAFEGCAALESISFPVLITEISQNAFYGCKSLKEIDLSGTQLVSIGKEAFSDCKEVVSLKLPNGVKSIEDKAFKNCSKLSKINLPDGLTNLGAGALSFTNIDSISLPTSITQISDFLFEGDAALRTFSIEDQIKSIGVGVFKDCILLDSVNVPERFTSIPAYFFNGCKNLSNVSFSSLTEHLGWGALAGCSRLERIEIPQTVKTIEGGCFMNCDNLMEIEIPAGIDEIPPYLLQGCKGLKRLTFGLNRYWDASWPNGLHRNHEIGEDAFSDCTSLEEIHVLDIVVPDLGYNCKSMNNVDKSKIKVFVPIETSEQYKREWEQYGFKEFIEEESEKAIVFIAEGFRCTRHEEDRLKVDILGVGPFEGGLKLEGDVIIPEATHYAGQELSIVGVRGGMGLSIFQDATTVSFPKTIEYIGGDGFSGWFFDENPFTWSKNLKRIDVDEENLYYFSDNGVLYQKKGIPMSLHLPDGPALLHLPASLSKNDTIISRYSIPKGVKSIVALNSNFTNKSVRYLSIPVSVDTILPDAFSNIRIDTIKIYKKTPPRNLPLGYDENRGVKVIYVPYKCKDAYTLSDPGYGRELATVIEMPNDQPTTVVAKSYSRKYGEENPTFEYEVIEGEIDGIPEITCDATEKTPVGRYEIVLRKGSETNTNMTYVAGTLTIEPAPLTISVGTYVIREGDPIPEFKLSFEGFKNDETADVLIKQPTIKCEATEESAPGEYDIIISGAEAQNYDISYVSGKLTVTELPSYTLTYVVDGTPYKTYTIKEGSAITPEEDPTKEGYTFSGWSEIPENMPAYDVTVIGSFTINTYTLTYKIDGEVYRTYEIEYGTTVTPEEEPVKEGYTFSGWSWIPQKMPAENVTVSGSFTVNTYVLTYQIDNEVYKTYKLEYGTAITPEEEPLREGYTFSGWSWIPPKMPAENVTVSGSFTANSYVLTYQIDGEVYKTYEIEYGTTVTPEEEPVKEGYTFSGWSWIPSKMPAENVIVTGSFTINSYKLTYMIGDEVYRVMEYEFGATITPEPQPEGDYIRFEWVDLPETMPASDVTVYADYETGIDFAILPQGIIRIYNVEGIQVNELQKGVNIVVMSDGTTRKVYVK